MKKYLILPALLLMSLLVATPSEALTVKTGQEVMVDEADASPGMVLVAGDKVTVDEDLSGSLLCAGTEVVINGDVAGDVVCAAEKLFVNGVVSGDVMFFGSELNYGDAGEVVGAVSQNEWGPGMMNGMMSENLGIDKNAIRQQMRVFGRVVSWSARLVALALGALVIALFPKWSKKLLAGVEKNMSQSILWGVAALVGIPVLSVMLIISIVGIPLVGAVVMLALVYMFVAKLLIKTYLGLWVLKRFNAKYKDKYIWGYLVGAPITWILFGLPLIGWAFKLFALTWAGGVVLLTIKASRKK